MNQLLQDALQVPSLPYCYQGRALDSFKLANIVELAKWFERHEIPAVAGAFMDYARGMKLNFGDDWKTRDNGFTMGASHHLKRRYADSMRMYYGISVEG